MPTLPELEDAFVKADRAGNSEDAAAFAAEIKRLRASPEVKGDKPGLGTRILNSLTAGIPNTGDMREFIKANPDAALSANSEVGTGGLTMPESQAAAAKTAATGTRLAAPIGGFLVGGVPGALVGGAGGEYAAQKIEGGPIRPGAILASGIASAIPGAPLASSGVRGVLREAVKQGAGGLLAKNIETLVDEGRMSSPTETAISVGVPAVGGALAQRIQANNPEIQGAVENAMKEGATRRATLAAGQGAGYVVPPSQVNPSFLNKRLESIAGKAAVGQQAAIKNQQITNKLAVDELGLPEGTEVTMTVLRDFRKKAAEPYAEIENMAAKAQSELDDTLAKTASSSAHETEAARAIPDTADKIRSLKVQAAADVDALRSARNRATKYFEDYRRNATPASLDEAESSLALANTLEERIEKAASEFGSPELVNKLKDARTKIAKSYDVERGVNLGDANISAPLIGRALDKDRPLTGNLQTIGRMAEAFPSVMREGGKIPTPGVSKVEAGLAALLGVGGFGAAGPVGALAGLAPLASGPARALVLSAPYQKYAARIPLSIDASPDKSAAALRLLSQEAAR